MATCFPPCPKCSGTMRHSPAIDGALCRCGFEVDHIALLGSQGPTGEPLKEFLVRWGRMIEIPKAAPGVRVSDKFSELDSVCWDTRGENWPVDGLQAAAVAKGVECGLAYQSGNKRGSALCVERDHGDGSQKTVAQLKREVMYGIAPRGNEIEAAERMVCAIANKHGHGRWWSMLDAVHVIADDGLARVADVGGVPHVFLRAAYFHDPSCPLCGKPCDRVEVGGVKLSGCQCVGTGDRAVAIDLSKLTKDPASRGFSYKATAAGRLEAARILTRELSITQESALELLQWPDVDPAPVDPFDVEYDGVKLRVLLARDQSDRRERWGVGTDPPATAVQRAAISAHWSAELRAKIFASKQKDRNQVTMEHDE